MAKKQDSAEEARKRLAEKLKKGKKVIVKKDGEVDANGDSDGIEIPKGKLAYHWYDEDPELLEEEKNAMQMFFPGFQLEKLDDGRLFWHGSVKTKVLNPDNQ